MAKQAVSAQSTHQSSSQLSFIPVAFGAGLSRVCGMVSDGATVEYGVFFAESMNRYALTVAVDNELVGFHCGERSGRLICFERESDAVRLADARNAAWRARSAKEVA